jgi:nucleoside-diphosphate-sugar epimerase
MIAITGATGLVGSHLAAALVARGERVRLLARSTSARDVFERAMAQQRLLPNHPLVEWVDTDLLDMVSVEEALEGVAAVFHCAAMVSFNPADRRALAVNNRQMTAHVVNACLYHAPQPLMIHVSSIAALGRAGTPGEPIDEQSTWKEGPENSTYARSKFDAELEVWRGMEEGLSVAVVNPGIILGEGRWTEGSARMFHQVYSGLKFYTEGINGFVDVLDVVQALIVLWEQRITGERFVLVAENRSYREVFDAMAQHLQVRGPHILAKPWMGQLVWRLEWLRNKLTGSIPVVTRDTARSAQGKHHYRNQKALAAGITFRPLEATIERVAKAYLLQLPSAEMRR